MAHRLQYRYALGGGRAPLKESCRGAILIIKCVNEGIQTPADISEEIVFSVYYLSLKFVYSFHFLSFRFLVMASGPGCVCLSILMFFFVILFSTSNRFNSASSNTFHLETLHHSKEKIELTLRRGGKIDHTIKYAKVCGRRFKSGQQIQKLRKSDDFRNFL